MSDETRAEIQGKMVWINERLIVNRDYISAICIERIDELDTIQIEMTSGDSHTAAVRGRQTDLDSFEHEMSELVLTVFPELRLRASEIINPELQKAWDEAVAARDDEPVDPSAALTPASYS